MKAIWKLVKSNINRSLGHKQLYAELETSTQTNNVNVRATWLDVVANPTTGWPG